MAEAEGDRRIRMRSGDWNWETVEPDPDLDLDVPHLRLVSTRDPEMEMRVEVEGDPLEMSDHELERAAARPVFRLWLDRQGLLWAVWPPEDRAVEDPDLARAGSVAAARTLTFEAEDMVYETPAPRPLGELKDEELQTLLDAEREMEAGVEEEWLGEEW